MIDSLTRNWWVQLIRGGLALTLGATALVAPGSDTGAGMTLAVFLVAAFAIGDGAMTVTTGLALPGEHRGRGGLIATGAGVIVLGMVVLFWPGLSATALTLVFAAWLVVSGALVAYGARTLRHEISDSWIMGALGAVLIALGFGLGLVGPSTIGTFVIFAGWFGLAVGAVMVAVAFRLRADAGRLPSPAMT
ncbi:HdeD family acid-resistance protein [Dietzia cercidiphylli]|uniref:HdeD family acid-resistance protein n=1 Tax=Dietzia cercidiphylli TaxID=498199 RepID=UPI003F80DF1D